MTRLALVALVALAAGCATPAPVPTPGAVTPAAGTPATTPPPVASCASFTVQAIPESGPAGSARTLLANFSNCGTSAIELSHACLRGMDIAILVLYNSTTPDVAAPPGVGPKASYQVDGPVAGLPLACATAPPHVREVPAGATRPYGVAWSGLYAPGTCADVSCARLLEPGRYLLAANALDAQTGQAYIATSTLVLT